MLLELADGRSESPLESLARYRFMQAGYAVDSQVPVASPNGGRFFVDLELVGLQVFCEVDGRGKYTDPRDRSLENVLREEKERADWIVATTGKRLVRIEMNALVDESRFAEWRRAHLIPATRPPPRRPGKRERNGPTPRRSLLPL